MFSKGIQNRGKVTMNRYVAFVIVSVVFTACWIPCLAQWNPWSDPSTCVGVSCLTGTSFRTRTCSGVTCVGPHTEVNECLVDCPFNATWTPFVLGECKAQTDGDCLVGRRLNERECVIDGPPFTQLPRERCEGGPSAAVMEETCSFAQCSNLTDVEPEANCSESCGNGYRMVERTCADPTPLFPDCKSELEYCNTHDCDISMAPSPVWARWGNFSECSSTCGVGVRTRYRSCYMGGSEVDSSFCAEGRPFEHIACNTALCDSYSSPPLTVCENVCNGSYVRLRECEGSGFAPRACLKRATNDTCANFADREQCGDPDIDIIFDFDTTNMLDDCPTKEVAFGQQAPFQVGQAFLTPANFPNFFRQKTLAIDLMNRWQTVSSSTTRVALHQYLDASCNNNFQVDFNQTGIRQLQVLDTSYTCGSFVFASQLNCALTLLEAAKGDRSTSSNFIIMPVTFTSSDLGILSALSNAANILLNTKPNTHLFLISTLKLDDPQYSTQAAGARQLACGSAIPVATCDFFLGSMWELSAEILARFRSQVLVVIGQ